MQLGFQKRIFWQKGWIAQHCGAQLQFFKTTLEKEKEKYTLRSSSFDNRMAAFNAFQGQNELIIFCFAEYFSVLFYFCQTFIEFKHV